MYRRRRCLECRGRAVERDGRSAQAKFDLRGAILVQVFEARLRTAVAPAISGYRDARNQAIRKERADLSLLDSRKALPN